MFERLKNLLAGEGEAPPKPVRTRPRGTEDPRQGDRGPHDRVPEGHDQVLYSLLAVLKDGMGADGLEPLDEIAGHASFWGFDGHALAERLAHRAPMLPIEELLARLKHEFSPHDFEKTVTLIAYAAGGRRIDDVSLKVFSELADASGHTAQALYQYLNEFASLWRLLDGPPERG